MRSRIFQIIYRRKTRTITNCILSQKGKPTLFRSSSVHTYKTISKTHNDIEKNFLMKSCTILCLRRMFCRRWIIIIHKIYVIFCFDILLWRNPLRKDDTKNQLYTVYEWEISSLHRIFSTKTANLNIQMHGNLQKNVSHRAILSHCG